MPANQETYRRLVRGEIQGPLAWLARLGLGLLSMPYGAAIHLRNAAYDHGWLSSAHASVPVVSFGNLTAGGTGKTPMVEWCARFLAKQGRKVCLLSRGYRSLRKPGMGTTTNDEAMVLAENLPGIPHLAGPNRCQNARRAVEEFGVDVLLLDDGFQHRALQRDLDIVLVDATDPFGGGRLLPAGLLREPISGIKRADAVIVTRADLASQQQLKSLRKALFPFVQPNAIPLVHSRFRPVELTTSAGKKIGIDRLCGLHVALVSGIGNPSAFERTVSTLGVAKVSRFDFPDHFHYSENAVHLLAEAIAGAKPDLILTTQKDLVKLRCEQLGGIDVWSLRIGVEFLDDASPLEQRLIEHCCRQPTVLKCATDRKSTRTSPPLGVSGA